MKNGIRSDGNMSFLPRPFTLINRPLRKEISKEILSIQKNLPKARDILYTIESGMITTTN